MKNSKLKTITVTYPYNPDKMQPKLEMGNTNADTTITLKELKGILKTLTHEGSIWSNGQITITN